MPYDETSTTMTPYYIYILKCRDGSYYTGITNHIEKRFLEHQLELKRNAYTFKRRPLSLEFHQECNTFEQAMTFEKTIKKWNRAKKEALIKGDFN